MSYEKFDQFLSKCAKDENLKTEFVKDPEKILKMHHINPDDIPADVAERLSAAGFYELGQAVAQIVNGFTALMNEIPGCYKTLTEGSVGNIITAPVEFGMGLMSPKQ